MSDATKAEVAARLGEPSLVVLDVRTEHEFAGTAGHHCDARQGHIPGARNVDVNELFALDAPGVRQRVGAPPGAEVIAYCHSGSRSAIAVGLLTAAGYRARNFPGSWHEWSDDDSLPIETA